MEDEDNVEGSQHTEEGIVLLPFAAFLQNVHPSVARGVCELWEGVKGVPRINTPDLRIHCTECDGERTFRSRNEPFFRFDDLGKWKDFSFAYRCGDCQTETKKYSLSLLPDNSGDGIAYKYGEMPPFGVPVPSRVLRLFGRDSALFLKGRQCENQGMGVGAFAYYRRVVENHKNDIFDEIISVCRIVNAPDHLIQELEQAKTEISFSKSISKIKTALPQAILIEGQNPLLLLHSALSVGLHNESDESCLDMAHAVRTVLTDLVEKIIFIKSDREEIKNATKLLISKLSGVSSKA